MADAVQQQAQITVDLVIILLLLCWTTVGLRLWVRFKITRSPGWDDAFMVFTLCLFTCYCSFLLVISQQGFLNQLPTTDSLMKTLVYIQLSEVFYILTTTTLKISLGLFFLRVLTKRWQILIFRVVLYISAIYGVFYVFIAIFQCGNPGKFLDSLIDQRRCLPTAFLLFTGYTYGVINVIADWTFVLIPIFVLVDSDMDRRSKVSVSIVMALGAVGSVSSILRMVYLRGLLFNGKHLSDAVRATIWATAEPGTGITAASIAILRPLFRKIKSDVQDKVSKHSSANSWSGTRATRNHSRYSHDSTITLTSVTTTVTANGKDKKKASEYAMPSLLDDTWDPRIRVQRAQIARVINVRMTTEVLPGPPVPPKT
ncbi:hypothetical protein BDV96DRAFT_312197 [Lophiotrema nucula]|uniref:Rhodopsin domain-containing protein n=1 Tax=Lophiotrema nucula TaxID=690887 RepID=A0A6A5ZKM8_9PLEO|nr:hypothetical protein BDV96DRAFT_312197 [Lophiotrema nucula]